MGNINPESRQAFDNLYKKMESAELRKIIRVDSSELPPTPLEMDPVLGSDKIYNSDLPSDE